jgi:lipoate-protein ligase A
MYVFDLGKLPGQQSMLIFHALARMGIEALVIVSPKIPLVSIGYFQDAEQEVDLQYCRESKIPFMRREVGGGATYLDENQIFYQLIWKKDNPKFPRAVHEIYPWFSEAPVETLESRQNFESSMISSPREAERSPEKAEEILESAWFLWVVSFSILTIKE